MPSARKIPIARRRLTRRLSLEMLESRRVRAAAPYGAMPQDTAEFMLGKVAVTPVFLESSGSVDMSTEDWTPSLIQETLHKVEEGVDWWVDLLATKQSVHTLEFVIDPAFAAAPVATPYEPISRVSNDFTVWVQKFVSDAGFNTPGGLDADMRAFNDAQRQKLHADWSFTIFVVNSTNDPDEAFASGGAFPRAFGFAGGLFFISPSERPASTFAHETGHIFWAKDEYVGGGSYLDRRGYYNAQNTNAADNPASGFVQEPSIMASGELLEAAYANHVSPASTLAMVGWRDSDEDGIFDVLDVPLELNGTGYYDSAAGAFKFRGSAKPGLLLNMNSEGLRNDITLNRISSVQYRVDAGAWTTFSEPDVYEADLDLTIPVASSGQVIEIRVVDAQTGVTSNVFQGRLTRADAAPTPGINGFVWIDANENGLRDPGEFGEAGWTVDVYSSTGEPLNLRHAVEPDSLPDGELTAGSVPGVSITAIGQDGDGRAGVFPDTGGSAANKVFFSYSRASQSWTSSWAGLSRRMKVDFGTPTSLVEIDAIGTGALSYGRIEAFDASGNLLDRFTTPALSDGEVRTMRIESSLGAIASVRIGGHANSSVRLDNLRFGPPTQVMTQLKGQFSVGYLPAGSYVVRMTPPHDGVAPIDGGGERREATVTAGGATTDIDFAFSTADGSWQNPANHLDVNDDQVVAALDVLLIVNEINANGFHDLPPISGPPTFYIDVNGDRMVSALDALWIINFINASSDGEAAPARVAVAAGPDGQLLAEAEAEANSARTPPGSAVSVDLDGSVISTPAVHDQALLSLPDQLESSRALGLELAWVEGPWLDLPGRRATRLATRESL